MARSTASSRWRTGDRVIVRATSCTVSASEAFSDCESLRLAKHTPSDIPFGILLLPFDRPRRFAERTQPRAVRPRCWLHALKEAAAGHRPFGALRCAARAHIDLLPYQLEPALAILRHGHLRVLIADAVGLGKTIQAGLVLAEVLNDDVTRRALVLTPAGLRLQWQAELAERFQVAATLCDAAWLRSRARELPVDINPWALPGTYLASIDFVKRPEVLASVEPLLWDLVIVDEAHLVTPGTDRRAAIDAVAARSRRVLLLTATPHSGDEGQFDALCRIGEGAARTPVVMFKRARADVGLGLPRRSVLLRVGLSDAEQRMHQLLETYAARLWRESQARGDRRTRLLAIVLRKRALSSAGSLAASLARRIALLSKVDQPVSLQLPLPLSDVDGDELDDVVRDEVLATPGLDDPRAERRWLGALLEAARSASRDERKVVRLRRFLARASQPAIVFTEYRDTLARLERAIGAPTIPLLTLHGGMSAAERRDAQRAFNDRPSLLLATDAAAEGLNLQQRCRLVIHFELPWNPLRLEQRAGRVDRLGQTRRVHEVALIADATAERIVLEPLAKRAAKARDATSSGGRMFELLDEWHVAEAVMAADANVVWNRTDKGSRVRADSKGTPREPIRELRLTEEAAQEATRLTREREWLQTRRSRHEEQRSIVTVLNRSKPRGAPTLTLVYAMSVLTPAARVTHSHLVAFVVPLQSSLGRPHSNGAAVGLVKRLLATAQPILNEMIGNAAAALSADVLPRHRALVESLREREIAIAAIRHSAAREIVQTGLFDRRALRDAERRNVLQDLRAEESAAAIIALDHMLPLTHSVQLFAALVRTD